MLEFESGLIFWTAVSFGILVVLLYRVALPPLLALLAQREKMSADSLSQAAEEKEKAAMLAAEQKQQLAEVRKQVDQMLAQAREEGDRIRAEIVIRAEKQAEKILEQSRQDLSREREKMVGAVKASTAELIVAAAGKLLRRVVSESEHHRLMKESIGGLENERN
jgi:F-type H+-transporting ATPase subunit b